MKIEQRIVFSIEEVRVYKEAVGLIDGANHILPPHMPSIAYKQLHIPWNYIAPIILRKQEIEIVEQLQVEEIYTVKLEIHDMKSRGERTFLEEELSIWDEQNRVLFISRSQLVTGGVYK